MEKDNQMLDEWVQKNRIFSIENLQVKINVSEKFHAKEGFQ